MGSSEHLSDKKLAIGFIRSNRAAALSTITPEGKPHVSIVYCIIHEDLNIHFTTRAKGRKFKSLIYNSEVCMVFTTHGSLQQLQLSGRAKRITQKNQQIKLLHELMKLRYADESLPQPRASLLRSGVRKEYAVFCVTPFEMTYANFETSRVGKYKPNFIKILQNTN